MFTLNATSSLPFGAITIYRLMNSVEAVVSAFISWSDARQTRDALAKLSDRQLADIGLSRSDI